MRTTYYAHSVGEDKKAWQTLQDHLTAVAGLAAGFAGRFNAAEFGQAAGVLHDLGKFSDEFQRRLEGAPLRVDHSTAGAQEAVRRYGRAAGTLLAYVAAGHHSGLPDYGSPADPPSLAARLNRQDLPDYDAHRSANLPFPQAEKLKLRLSLLKEQREFGVHFFIRMLYSCLVDADFLDTERVLSPDNAAQRRGHPTLVELRAKLQAYMADKYASATDTRINRERAAILQACRVKAAEPPGLFTLTVPTGGGKTLSSLTFALDHAVKYGLERVVYVIPFTSIIEQNAAVFRQALGDGAVLEHHSNFRYPDETDDDYSEALGRLRLSTENWDAPVIVTTNVQFFESLFSNRSSQCRKLHNLARSVIILDEAQMLPTNLLKPCLAALWELVLNYGATVVLCTATQPALRGLLPAELNPREIAPDPARLFEVFRRVTVEQLGAVEDSAVAGELARHRQALCIVNTRSHARELYDLIRGEEGAVHLSARMCPRHRAAVLADVRQKLRAGLPCRVVATQLIEAGVDVDFPVVFRAAAGLDSVAQAAGRCNREGRLKNGQVFVFEPVGHPLRGWFQRTAAVAGMVLRSVQDPLSLEAIESYFGQLYGIEGEGLDRDGILRSIAEGGGSLHFPFATVGQHFRLIESELTPVVIPWDDEARELLGVAHFVPSYALLRQLQPYVVQVYPYEYRELERIGAVRLEGGIIPVLTDSSLYSEEVGLQPPAGGDKADDLLIY